MERLSTVKKHHQYCIYEAPFNKPGNMDVTSPQVHVLDPWMCFTRAKSGTISKFTDIHEWGFYPPESRFCLDQVPLDQFQYASTATYNEKGVGFAWGFGADKKLIGRLGTIQLVNQCCNKKQLIPPVLILQLNPKVIVDKTNPENSYVDVTKPSRMTQELRKEISQYDPTVPVIYDPKGYANEAQTEWWIVKHFRPLLKKAKM